MRKEMRTRIEPWRICNSLDPSSISEISHMNNSAIPLWFRTVFRTPCKDLKVLYKLKRVCILAKQMRENCFPKTLPRSSLTQHTSTPNPELCCEVMEDRKEILERGFWKIKREVERRVGGKDRVSRGRRGCQILYIFLRGLILPHERETRHKNVAPQREAKKRLEMGTQEFKPPSSSLFWKAPHGCPSSNPQFPYSAMPRGGPQGPSEKQGAGAVWRQHSLLSSKNKVLPLLWSSFPNWNEPPAFPWHCFSSAQTWEKHFPRMEVTSLADQITCWLQAASTAVPGADYSQLWARYFSLDHRTRVLAPTSLPRQPWGQERICALVSSPPWLVFSLHWRLAISTPTSSCSHQL